MDEFEQRKTFARNLKKWMDLKGKTQMDLMNDLNVPSPTVSSWVNGKKYPRIDKMQMLADYFGILKSDLMEEKGDEQNELDRLRERENELKTLEEELPEGIHVLRRATKELDEASKRTMIRLMKAFVEEETNKKQ